jgi:hypothetical protein
MHNYQELAIGVWYKSPEIQDIFEIVALDPENDCIEIQYFNGEIEEMDLSSWNELNIVEIDPPEDWSGAYEMNKEDLENYEDIIRPEDWGGPLTHLDKENDQY